MGDIERKGWDYEGRVVEAMAAQDAEIERLRTALREVVRRAEGGRLNTEWVALPAKDALARLDPSGGQSETALGTDEEEPSA